jgi:hypothetical protein
MCSHVFPCVPVKRKGSWALERFMPQPALPYLYPSFSCPRNCIPYALSKALEQVYTHTTRTNTCITHTTKHQHMFSPQRCGRTRQTLGCAVSRPCTCLQEPRVSHCHSHTASRRGTKCKMAGGKRLSRNWCIDTQKVPSPAVPSAAACVIPHPSATCVKVSSTSSLKEHN